MVPGSSADVIPGSSARTSRTPGMAVPLGRALAAGRCRLHHSQKLTLAVFTDLGPYSGLKSMCCSANLSNNRWACLLCVCCMIVPQLSQFQPNSSRHFCAVPTGCGDACCVPHIMKSTKAVKVEARQETALSLCTHAHLHACLRTCTQACVRAFVYAKQSASACSFLPPASLTSRFLCA